MGHSLPDILCTSTGSPQGCVLGPLLFILHTDGLRPVQPSTTWDSLLVTLCLRPCSLVPHGSLAWLCRALSGGVSNSCLEFNTNRTKEMTVTFSPKQMAEAVTAQTLGDTVELVKEVFLKLWENYEKKSSEAIIGAHLGPTRTPEPVWFCFYWTCKNFLWFCSTCRTQTVSGTMSEPSGSLLDVRHHRTEHSSQDPSRSHPCPVFSLSGPVRTWTPLSQLQDTKEEDDRPPQLLNSNHLLYIHVFDSIHMNSPCICLYNHV